MTAVYCDRTDCIFEHDGECMKTSIVIQSDCSFSGAYCASVEIRKAPASPPADQEPPQ